MRHPGKHAFIGDLSDLAEVSYSSRGGDAERHDKRFFGAIQPRRKQLLDHAPEQRNFGEVHPRAAEIVDIGRDEHGKNKR